MRIARPRAGPQACRDGARTLSALLPGNSRTLLPGIPGIGEPVDTPGEVLAGGPGMNLVVADETGRGPNAGVAKGAAAPGPGIRCRG